MDHIIVAVRNVLIVALATAGATATSRWAFAADRTWDGGGANSNWSTPANWDGDLTAPSANDTLTFDGLLRLSNNNNLTADTQFGPITFTAGAGSYVISGNRITLAGDIINSSPNPQELDVPLLLNANRGVSVDAGGMLTLGSVISETGGSFSLTKSGAGTLALGANNTYTGGTIIDGGTLAYVVDQTNAPALAFGVAPTSTSASTNVGALDLTGANVTASSLTVQTNSTTANTITIGSGKTLTVNGPMTVGVSDVFTQTNPGARTVLNISGNSLVVNAGTGNFQVGIPRSNAASGGDPAATLDMSQLSNFSFTTSTGEFRVGQGGNIAGTVLLANTSNSITAAAVRIGDTAQPNPGNNIGNNGGASTLTLGPGTNVIHTNSIVVGAGKTTGTINFGATDTTGTLTIAGEDGTSPANLTIGNATSATNSGTGTLNLDGHAATIQAGTVIVGRMNNSSGGPAGTGTVRFDTGTFNIANLQMATQSLGTNSNGAIGTFFLGGPNPGGTGTGVLNVSTQFLLANRTNTSGGIANGTFNVYGGTANVNADIVDASTTGARTTTLTVDGGTLNMMGHNIGSAAAPLTTINLNSGNLNNAATVAAGAITIQPTITITGAPNYLLADGGTLTSNLPTLNLVSGGGIGGGGPTGANVIGEVAAGTGSTITPGTSSVAATMQFNSNLSLANNSTANFKLSENAASGNDQISVSGNLALAGTVNVAIGTVGLGPQVGNTYTLFNYTGTLTGNQSNIAVQDPKTRATFTIVPTATTPGTIQVSVGGAGPANLTWIGNNGNNWDLITTANFRDAALTAQKFFNQDAVTFDDTSTNANDIQLVGTLLPGPITVNATRNYKFAGTGTIAGGATLTKSGTGALVVVTNNTYAGGTTINAGTLQVGDGGTSGSLGTGPIANEGTLVFNRSDAITVSNVISGSAGPVRQDGNGTITFSGNNTFFGGLIVNHGTVRLGSASAAGTGTAVVNAGGTYVVGGGAATNPITMNGGTLGSAFGGTQTSITTADFTINPSTTATVYTADPQNLATNGEVVLTGTGTLRGSGNINVLSGSNVASPDGAPGFRLQGTNPSDYSGMITIGHNAKGELQTASAGPQSPAGTGNIVLTAGDANLGNTLTAATTTGGYTELNLRNNSPGDTTLGNDVQVTGTGLALLNPLGSAPVNAVVNMGKLSVGAGQEVGMYLASGNTHVVSFQSVTLNGTAKFSPKTPGFGATTSVGSDLALNNVTESVAGSGVTMAGLRTLYLNGTNTYTGPTQVLSGTLGGTGSVTSPVTVNTGAAIGPGTSAVPVGSFSAPSVSISGALNIDIDDFSAGVQDVLNVTGALALNNAAVNFTVANNLAAQPAYVFAHYGSLAGNPFVSFNGIPDGYTVNYNYQNLKEIALVPLATPLKLGDFNFDGHVNNADVTAMMTALADLTKFAANNTLTPTRLIAVGDLDASGAVNNLDLQGLLTLLKSGGGSVASVPEPATALLVGMALLSAAIVWRRRETGECKI